MSVSDKPVVVLTRTESDSHILSDKYSDIKWIEFPLIKFEYQPIPLEKVDHINSEIDWLVFTSQNAVRSFFEQVDLKTDKEIACVGPKTRKLVESYGHKVSFVPNTFTSFALAIEIPASKSDKICYVGGNLSNNDSLTILRNKSAEFLKVEAYHTIADFHSEEEWKELMSNKLNIISFCSPSAVHSFLEQVQQYDIILPIDVRYAAIGTTTGQSIKDDIRSHPIIGEKHTFAAMIDQIVESIDHDSKT